MGFNWCLENAAEPTEYWPKNRWVSFQSLKPEVQAWVEAQYRHPVAFTYCVLPTHDYRIYLPLQVVLLATLERETMVDLASSHTILHRFSRPDQLELEDVLLTYSGGPVREWQARRLLYRDAISPRRFRDLWQGCVQNPRERQIELDYLVAERGYERPVKEE